MSTQGIAFVLKSTHFLNALETQVVYVLVLLVILNEERSENTNKCQCLVLAGDWNSLVKYEMHTYIHKTTQRRLKH